MRCLDRQRHSERREDYLDHLIGGTITTRPGSADVWVPYALMLDLSAERVRLGLSQQEVAERMGVGHPAVARMENRPEGVSFARIARYAQAVGATLKVVPGDGTPKPAGGTGRPVAARRGRSAAPPKILDSLTRTRHKASYSDPVATQAEIEALYPHLPLKGQTAIVTGANSGIGEGVARHLAVAGANVAVNWITNPDTTQKIVDEINAGAGGQAIGVQADVSDEAQVQAMFKTVVEKFGTVDVLVANAGLQRDSAFADMTLEGWEFVLKVNLTGQFLCSREAVREFKRRGMRDGQMALGKIIHMSSVHEVIPWAGHVNYATSKGGIMQLMKSSAQELAPDKIRVNGIGPGAIETPINTSAWNTPEALQKLLTLIPYGRAGVPDDIGKVAVFLASDASDYMTGQTLFVDGGMTLYPGFATGG